ncbi:quinone oxidoreductase [Burkholderia pseudomallei]|uniref:zinc-binding dehydrogenase n=1 Tax=Burkholderia pseudomallei TaxID=28450 RepID=UPI000F23BAB5|nr:zinc-binding dehydrogenase [Burkholderia pseudomallei]CAJ3166185.1 quinone oxidoreductase [Burkholderia pseudomallei]
MREITGGAGARVAFDPVAGALLPQLADALALGGIVIEYGALAAEQAPFPLFAVLGKRLSVHGYRYKRVGGDPAKLDAATRFVLDGLASGALKPTLDRVFPLDQIADAHRYPESNEQFGEIAVTV